MSPIALTCAQSRELDRRAIEELGMSGLVLMENAGRCCVDVMERLGIPGPVVVLCGKGNNAGDGFVIARHLEIRGYECQVLLLCPMAELHGDAATNFKILQSTSVPIIDLSQRAGASPPPSAELRHSLTAHTRGATWLIDALLGTGASGEPRPPFDAAIDCINLRSQTMRALAVDVPSGLDCDTGNPAEYTVVADHTCTFAALKSGYLQKISKAYTGVVHVCDIGVPKRLIKEVAD
jgi:NAD(P)H-hydrate epimerase